MNINTKIDLSSELQLLIACCQDTPSEKEIEYIKKSIKNSKLILKDWQNLVALAHQHGVFPLFYHSLRLHASSLIPSKIMAKLKAHNMAIVQRNMLMNTELIHIMKLLEENNIDALAFKGPTLSQMAYGDITLRQYSDLDILVDKKNIATIEILLKKEKYERSIALTPQLEKFGLRFLHDLGLYHPQKSILIEIHWSLLDDDFPIQINLEKFCKERQEVKLNGHSIPTFSNENLFLYLCIHGSKHLWERVEWVKDLDLFIRNEEINWEDLMVKAKKSGFDTMLYFGLSLTVQLFNTPLPKRITKIILEKKELEFLQNYVFQNWIFPKNIFQTITAMLKLFPNFKEKIFYLHKSIFTPSRNEYQFIDLPKGFYWVYYLIRPYLLLKKYTIK